MANHTSNNDNKHDVLCVLCMYEMLRSAVCYYVLFI